MLRKKNFRSFSESFFCENGESAIFENSGKSTCAQLLKLAKCVIKLIDKFRSKSVRAFAAISWQHARIPCNFATCWAALEKASWSASQASKSTSEFRKNSHTTVTVIIGNYFQHNTYKCALVQTAGAFVLSLGGLRLH